MTSAAVEVRGARQHNLRDVDVDIPKGLLVVVTGVSGSGKSSLVHHTIAAESKRQLNATYPAFIQSLLPALPRPDVDELRNLGAVVAIEQDTMAANVRSTVGTATDVWTLLRTVYAALGEPKVDGPSSLSFNDPRGMCPACDGLGRVSSMDLDALLDRSLSLDDGAITFPNFAPDSLFWSVYANSGKFDTTVPLEEWSPQDIDELLRGTGGKVDTGSYNLKYEGLLDKIERLYLSKDVDSLQAHVRRAVERVATFADCPDCEGTRLGPHARACTVAGRSLADCATLQIDQLVVWARSQVETGGRRGPEAAAFATLTATLERLAAIGLGYLTLSRESGTLSGGEAQRVRMVRHLGSSLTDLTYVLDEPTAGLHPADTERMVELLQQLRDSGNTVIVVAHDVDVIANADHVIDLGPGAGTDGGQLIHSGALDTLGDTGSVTAPHLDRPVALRRQPREASGEITVRDVTRNNLDGVDLTIPRGVLTAVTGVAGAGKSTLVSALLDRHDDVHLVDQSPIKGSSRSNPATWSGVMDDVRAVYAKANGVKAGLFSSNSDGACDGCRGLGVVHHDLGPIGTVTTTCDMCDGARYAAEVLQHTLRDIDIAQLLAMSITDAADHLAVGTTAKERTAAEALRRMVDTGIGYVRLGQPLTTLSGGERQRLRLAVHLGDDAPVLVLDEPTNGLHPSDVDHLLHVLDQIVDAGRTVVVVEHHPAVIGHADHVVDIGPGAGDQGGTIVYEGPPAGLLDASTPTGVHLARRAE